MRPNLRPVFICAVLFVFQNCGQQTPAADTRPLHADHLPANALPVDANITDLNCWQEQNFFFVTGICNNNSAEWRRFWLDLVPLDAAGKPLLISGRTSVMLNTLSTAVPPQGRTTFYGYWPLTDFSGTPASGRLKALAQPQTPGPILLTQDVNALKVMAPPAPGQAATEEIAWQVSGALLNPLPLTAARPCFEVLAYGTDNRLWSVSSYDPADATAVPNIHLEGSPMAMNAGEQRGFGLNLRYELLPQALREKKIGRVEVLAFEKR